MPQEVQESWGQIGEAGQTLKEAKAESWEEGACLVFAEVEKPRLRRAKGPPEVGSVSSLPSAPHCTPGSDLR